MLSRKLRKGGMIRSSRRKLAKPVETQNDFSLRRRRSLARCDTLHGDRLGACDTALALQGVGPEAVSTPGQTEEAHRRAAWPSLTAGLSGNLADGNQGENRGIRGDTILSPKSPLPSQNVEGPIRATCSCDRVRLVFPLIGEKEKKKKGAGEDATESDPSSPPFMNGWREDGGKGE